MNYWTEEKHQERRRQRMMADAEIDRQIPKAHGSIRLPTRASHILLARLGTLLYRWGCNLQARYGRLLLTTEGHDIGFSYPRRQVAADAGAETTPCSG
jgi:hypothetical protein